ncbi:MAG: AraC family transcriptional regulator [Clostridia bacterium]|nr:AraC family transcriptional regulator [Clostridia bacterium]
MNIYKSLNEVIKYIENNLEDTISYSYLAKIVGVNEYTFLRVFDLIANISVADYIRNRRLSNAGIELLSNSNRIMDIAIKYNYESSTSFSRAFERFHGIKPSEVSKNSEKLKVFPILHFQETETKAENIEYSIIQLNEFTIYGKGIKTTYNTIHKDAPNFYNKFEEKYQKIYGNPDFGMIIYEDRFISDNFEYWVLYKKEIREFTKYTFQKSKWIKLEIPSQNPIDIQNMSAKFYNEFLPSCKYNLKNLPELEYYHDEITDFLIAIED